MTSFKNMQKRRMMNSTLNREFQINATYNIKHIYAIIVTFLKYLYHYSHQIGDIYCYSFYGGYIRKTNFSLIYYTLS